MPRTNLHETRESWLLAAFEAVRPIFSINGYELPEKVRISVGFTSYGRRKATPAESFSGRAANDSVNQIFMSPHISDALEVVGGLTHISVHLVTGPYHDKAFREVALRIGLVGPMRDAKPGPVLTERLNGIVEKLGPYPHAGLNFIEYMADGSLVADRPKKQGTRMRLVECREEGCRMKARLTRACIDEVGIPHCPKHGAMEEQS